MSTIATAFQWLEILEKEFDKAYMDLDFVISSEQDDFESIVDVKNKMGIMASIFAQTAQKALTIFENSAKIEAINVALKSDLVNCIAENATLKAKENSSADITPQKQHILEADLQVLRKENDAMKNYIMALQTEVFGARLAAKYLDKELAGRIQQLQLLSRKMDGPEHERLWCTLEAEIHLHRHKTVVRACQGRHYRAADYQIKAGDSAATGSRSPEQPLKITTHADPTTRTPNSVRRVRLIRTPQQSLGLSVTGGCEHGVPLTISAVHPGTVAAQEGLLSVGDVIVAVNNQDLRSLKHAEAVRVLSSAEGEVVLDVMYMAPGPCSDEDDDNLELIADNGQRFRLYEDSFTKPCIAPPLVATRDTANAAPILDLKRPVMDELKPADHL